MKYPAIYYRKCLTKMDYHHTKGWWIRIFRKDGTMHSISIALSGRSWGYVKKLAIQARDEYVKSIYGVDWLEFLTQYNGSKFRKVKLRKPRINHSLIYRSGVIGVSDRQNGYSYTWIATWVKWVGDIKQPKAKAYAAKRYGETESFLLACVKRAKEAGELIIVNKALLICSLYRINSALKRSGLEPAIVR